MQNDSGTSYRWEVGVGSMCDGEIWEGVGGCVWGLKSGDGGSLHTLAGCGVLCVRSEGKQQSWPWLGSEGQTDIDKHIHTDTQAHAGTYRHRTSTQQVNLWRKGAEGD